MIYPIDSVVMDQCQEFRQHIGKGAGLSWDSGRMGGEECRRTLRSMYQVARSNKDKIRERWRDSRKIEEGGL